MTKGKIVSILCVIMLAISGVLVWVFNPFGEGDPSLKDIISVASTKIEETIDNMISVSNKKAQEQISINSKKTVIGSSKLDNFTDHDKYRYYVQSMRNVEAMVDMVNQLLMDVTTQHGYDADFQCGVVYQSELKYMGKIYLKCIEMDNGVQVIVDTETEKELVNIIIEYNAQKKIEKVLLSSGKMDNIYFTVLSANYTTNEINFISVAASEAEDTSLYGEYNSGTCTLDRILEENLVGACMASANMTENPNELVLNFCEYINGAEGNVLSDKVNSIYDKVYENTSNILIRTDKMDTTNSIKLDAFGKAYIRSMNKATIENIEDDGKVFFVRSFIGYDKMLEYLNGVKSLINNDNYTTTQKEFVDYVINYIITGGKEEFLGWFNTLLGNCDISISCDIKIREVSNNLQIIRELSLRKNGDTAGTEVRFKIVDDVLTEML